jgi:uroporphyrinogen-III decarboxylase
MPELPSREEKKAVWDAYRARNPVRVPLRWSVNSRIVLLNPALNPEGYDYRQYFNEPRVTLTVQARFQEYLATTLARTCDALWEIPETWGFYVENQNVYDAAYFGAEVRFEAGQVPDTRPFLTLDSVDEFLKRDFSKPLENPWIRDRLAFRERLVREAETFTYLGRRGKVGPFGVGFDGPLTVATNLMGSDVFLLLAEQSDKAARLLAFITEACAHRNRALADLAGGWKKADWGGLADDSIQLISTRMYEDILLPIHEAWYSAMSATKPTDGKRSIHLCGDATRHFPLIHERLGVTAFDTGFPVHHGALRRALGPDVEISGGPRVDVLRNGTPEQCAEAARAVLRSGVTDGGRFILQEANNLPPCVPLENLSAVYETCIAEGRIQRPTPNIQNPTSREGESGLGR